MAWNVHKSTWFGEIRKKIFLDITDFFKILKFRLFFAFQSTFSHRDQIISGNLIDASYSVDSTLQKFTGMNFSSFMIDEINTRKLAKK